MAENKRPIVTGLCAFGMSGRMFQAPFLHAMDEFSLHAVVERHAKRVANTYPDIRSYDSIESMLADPAIELVVVNTPNVDHFEHVRLALLAGKHVVVEKPFSVTSAQAVEMVERLASARREVLAIQLLTVEERDFPFAGGHRFRDPETGEELLGDGAAMRDDFLSRFADARAALRARLDADGVRHATYVLDEELDAPLVRLFGAHSAAEYS